MVKGLFFGLSVLLLGLFFSGCVSSSANISNDIAKFNGKSLEKKGIQIYGHRGIRGLVPENSIPSYKSVLKLGVDYVDMDVNIAKDGTVVVTHDFTLNKNLTRENGEFIKEETPIYELTYKELKNYDIGALKKGTKYASYFPYQIAMNGVYMPTLKEVIRYVKSISNKDVGFQIEIKTDASNRELTATPKEYAKAVHKILKEENIIDISEIQAFDFEVLIELNRIDADVKTAYLTDHETDPKGGYGHTLWTAGHSVMDFDGSFPKMIKALGGYCWEPYEMDLTKESLDEAHALGLKVVVWGWPEVEGSEFNYERVVELIEWGVDGIITDRADILRGLLSARGYALPKGYIIE